MSLAAFDTICREFPELEADVRKLESFLAECDVESPLRLGRIEDFTGIKADRVVRVLERLPGDLVAVRQENICGSCDRVIEGDGDEEKLFCDTCQRTFSEREVCRETCYFLLRVVTRSTASPGGTRKRTMTNPLADPAQCTQYRIEPWKTLDEAAYLQKTTTLSANARDGVLQKLERYGLCLIRWEAGMPTAARLESLGTWIGPPRERQNDFAGRVKQIRPRPDIAANTGDSAKELDVHVDGTQDEFTPGILAFQYGQGPEWGGDSTFVDMAAVPGQLPFDRLDALVSTLSRAGCASCQKEKVQGDGTAWRGEFCGPLIRAVSSKQAVSLRVRLDDLLKAKPEARGAFDELRNLIRNWTHRVRYVPHEGDIVLFDNWRVLHGRAAVGGWHERFHDRMWIDQLSSEYDGKYLLGVRPLGNALMASVEQMNALSA